MIPNSSPAGEYKIEEIEGVKLKIVELIGPDGAFQVAFARSGRESCKWLYRRNKQQFFFYGFVDYREGIAEITSLSPKLVRGGAVKIDPVEFAIFKRNIELWFNTRGRYQPWKFLSPGTVIKLTFSEGMSL